MIETKRIFLTGGGTGGSATPLIAIAEKLHQSNQTIKLEWFWIGSNSGLEKDMVESFNTTMNFKIEFHAIANGKLRRYFSLLNLLDIFLILIGFIQSLYLIIKYRPDIILSAGSYISVPVVWAGFVLRKPAMIHQQDFEPGLANKLMAPFCKAITVTFEKSLRDYKQATLTGNLIRPEIFNLHIDKISARQKMGLNNDLPVIFAIGGATGAEFINDLITANLPALTKFCQIIHVTGKNRLPAPAAELANYRCFEFLHIDGLIKAYTAADIVISRAGMGVLSEIAWLAKPSIVIPMPNSHQESNAKALSDSNAALVLDQQLISADDFVTKTRELLYNKEARDRLGANLKNTIKIDQSDKIIEIINNIINNHETV